jgi:hypothetical protein
VPKRLSGNAVHDSPFGYGADTGQPSRPSDRSPLSGSSRAESQTWSHRAQGTNRGRDCLWATPTRPAGRDASVPWGSPAITSRREHGLSLATAPGRSPNSRTSQVGALASQFCPRIPSRHQGADQACQGEVGRTSTVMEKLTGIRPCVVGPDTLLLSYLHYYASTSAFDSSRPAFLPPSPLPLWLWPCSSPI